MCFKHDNNVCTCAVSALILLPVVNLSLEMDSATSISYITGKVTPFNAAFRLVKVIFHCACAVYTTFLFFCRFGWKIPIHYSGPFFRGFCGVDPLNGEWYQRDPQKYVLGWIDVMWHITVKISPTVRPVDESKEQNRLGKKPDSGKLAICWDHPRCHSWASLAA